jgi:dTDP-4-dehydrorhamnose reductase
MRVLVLGAGGMLGYTLYRHLAADLGMEVHGSLRMPLPGDYPVPDRGHLHMGVDALDDTAIDGLVRLVKPDALINCVGLIKQREQAQDPLAAISLNASLPHRIARTCTAAGARLIHVSTDCVFSGRKGGYRESDAADADDLYGRSKRLGEVDYGGHLTLRTSLIGHELARGISLVDWFLGQRGTVTGYGGAVFSGLPTVEIARVLRERILPRRELAGLYHLSAAPIDKDRLLRLVARQYGHDIAIHRETQPAIDRSLDSSRLRAALGYAPPAWEELVAAMHADYLQAYAPARRRQGDAP